MGSDSSSNSGLPTGVSNSVMFTSRALRRGTVNVAVYCKLAARARRSPIVSGTNNDHREIGPAGTLGDLLYADQAKPRVSETEWRELVQAVAAGDQLALRALYDRSHRLVFTLTMRILGRHYVQSSMHFPRGRSTCFDPRNRFGIGCLNVLRQKSQRLRSRQRVAIGWNRTGKKSRLGSPARYSRPC